MAKDGADRISVVSDRAMIPSFVEQAMTQYSGRSECGAGTQEPAGRSWKVTATTTMQCIYSSVSKASLQKTGVLLNSAGDFRDFSPKKFENGATGDFQQLKKPAIGGPFYY